MKHLSIIAILFVFAQMSLCSGAAEKEEEKPYPEVTDELALNMLKKYQAINSYHCLWQGESTLGEMQAHVELEIAYERKTGKTLIVMYCFQDKEDRRVMTNGHLLINDGQKIQNAISRKPGHSKRLPDQIIAEPDKFKYRDYQKTIPFLFLWDLPLLYPDHALTEYPLMEILQGDSIKLRMTEADPKASSKMPTVELMTDKTLVKMHLDSKTLLIKEFESVSKIPGKNPAHKYKQTSVSIDNPLKPELFNFETQLKNFETTVSEKKYTYNPTKVTNTLALKMMKKYQAIKTYHCLWRAEGDDGKEQMRTEIEAAYERKTGKTLFIVRGCKKIGEKWKCLDGQVSVFDGKRFRGATTMGPREPRMPLETGKPENEDPIREGEIKIAVPNDFSYNDFIKGVGFVYPWDLPLLYPDYTLTEYPLVNMACGNLEDIRSIEPDSNKPAALPVIELITHYNSTCTRLYLDPKTMIIKEFTYFRPKDSKDSYIAYPKFKQVSLSIDKTFKPGFFDYDAQLNKFKSEYFKDKPADVVSRE